MFIEAKGTEGESFRRLEVAKRCKKKKIGREKSKIL